VPGQVGDAVAVDVPVDLDHRAARQRAGLGRVGRCGRRPGRAGAAHLERGQVFGVQAGRERLGQLPADEHVDAVLVGPHVGELTGPDRAQLDPLHRGMTPSTPLAEITVSNSTAPADWAASSTGTACAGPAGSGAGGGTGTARTGSG
jgi:hypothetical protein